MPLWRYSIAGRTGAAGNSRAAEGLYEVVPRRRRRSDSTGKQQDDNNREDESNSSGRIIAPAFAMRPCGYRTDKRKNQNQDQKDSKHASLPTFVRCARVRRCRYAIATMR